MLIPDPEEAVALRRMLADSERRISELQKAQQPERLDDQPAGLLPCPFCGHTRLVIERSRHSTHGWTYYILCLGCGTEGPWKKTKSGARARWNERVPREEAPDADE